MKYQRLLLSFETMLDYLNRQGFASQINQIVRKDARATMVPLERNTAIQLPEEYHIQYRNTWWELYWPGSQGIANTPPECLYLADSFRDALRKRPNIDITFGSNTPKMFAEYLKSTEDCIEEADNLEYAEH